MTEIDRRDREILGFIVARGEVFFKELQESGMMAKSTLSKHLKDLRRREYIEKTISKKRRIGQYEVVYTPTPRGREVYSAIVGGHHMSLDDL